MKKFTRISISDRMGRKNTGTYLLFVLGLLIMLGSCEMNQKEFKPADEFVKIYNHPDEGLTFFPVALTELDGGGYLILSGLKADSTDQEFPTSYLIRTSEAGEIEWSREYSWYAPAGLFQMAGTVGFVAMDAGLNAYAVQVELSEGTETGSQHLEVDMPLGSMVDGEGNLLVLAYDYVSRSSWLSLFSSSFNLQSSTKLLVNTDLEDQVQRHLNKTGIQYPFFMGEWDDGMQSGYYVNCFSNYSLRTVFFDGGLTPKGNIYSFQTEAAVSSLIQRTGNNYALSRYYAGNNYLLGDVGVDINSSQNFNDIDGTNLNELTPNAKVLADRITIGNSGYLLFSSQTNSNSIISYQHHELSDSLLATHVSKFNERVEIADLVQAEDGGVAVLAQIYILGRFQRTMLIKNPQSLYQKGE